MAKNSQKLPWMQFYPSDWSKDPALTLCTPATRGVWIDLICAMHLLDRSGELRGTADQLARFARCSTVEFVHAMTDLQTNRAADVTERNGLYHVCNRRMAAAHELRKSNADKVKRHRERRRNPECNRVVTGDMSEVRIENPPPPNRNTSSKSDGWEGVEEVLFGHGIAKAPEAVKAVREAGCTVIQTQNVIEFWRARQPAWGPGALYDRLLRLRPNQPFDQHWPDCVSDNGRRQVTADEFKRLFSEGKFTSKPQHHATKPEIVFGTLRTGEKIECRDYPLKKKLA